MSKEGKHIIFIDTSVFESENFFKGRNLIHLCDLSKDSVIELKITDIVYKELIQRIKENTSKADRAFKKAYPLIDNESKILKNMEEFDAFFPLPIIDVETVSAELISKLDKFLKESLIEIIDSKISDTKEVFNDYFDIKPPFKEGKKKSEFPDAFTYSTIKQWVKLNHKDVYFISNDSDFDELTTTSINCTYNLSTIIDLISREIDEKHTVFIEEIYENSTSDILHALEKDYSNELMDAVYNKIQHDPYYEEPEIDPPDEIEVVIDIGVINEIVLNSSFSYEVESDITFSVNVEYIDLSTAFYDKEDGIWYGEERRSETKNYSANVISIAEFSYDLEDDNGFYYQMSNFNIRSLEEV